MRALLAVAGLLLLTSCGGAGTAEGARQDPGDLWGRSFVSTEVAEDGEPRPLVQDTRVELTFEDQDDHGDMRFRAGCNIMGSSLEITEDRLVVSDGIASTEMGCRDELHDQDDWLADFFGSGPRWELSDDRLTLTSGATLIGFEERRR